MTYDHKKIKKQVQAESMLYTRFGPGRIWSFLLKEIFHNDVSGAIEFLLSDEGGFELSEVDRIISKNECYERIYNNKLICGLEA